MHIYIYISRREPRQRVRAHFRARLRVYTAHARSFKATVQPSWFDGRPALVLEYDQGDSLLWGTLLGMRDELREVAPGVWLGLGSMRATGGVRNAAPFVMWSAARKDRVGS